MRITFDIPDALAEAFLGSLVDAVQKMEKARKRARAKAVKEAREPLDAGIHARVIEEWELRFRAETEHDYAFQGARDGAAVKTLLEYAKGDVNEIVRRADHLFMDDWHVKQATLPYFASIWNKLAQAPQDGMSAVLEFAEGGE